MVTQGKLHHSCIQNEEECGGLWVRKGKRVRESVGDSGEESEGESEGECGIVGKKGGESEGESEGECGIVGKKGGESEGVWDSGEERGRE